MVATAAPPAGKASPNETGGATQALGLGALGVFGSVELKANKVDGNSQWRRMLRRTERESDLYEACDQAESSCPRKVRQWRKSLKSFARLEGYELLAAVNSRMNKLIAYRDDIMAFGVADHWASPAESLTGEGDCEDYAILKYLSLRELGVSDRKMRIVVVKDMRRGIGHAVLSVRLDGKLYILDSLRKRPVVHTKIGSRYMPYYSLNGEGQWLNIAARKRDRKVASRKTIKIGFKRQIVIAKPRPAHITKAVKAAIAIKSGTAARAASAQVVSPVLQ